MIDFWNVLTKLISQYSVADTAYVISIVEGIATVVAAVGAIIAVIVTVKIAKNQDKLIEKQNDIAATQNDLTKEQNSISKAQADIARQQNRITLFEKRENAYNSVQKFFGFWEVFGSEASLESLKGMSVNIFAAYISVRELGILDMDFVKHKEWFHFHIKQGEFTDSDINCLASALRLFVFPKQQVDFIKGIIIKHQELSKVVLTLKNSECSTDNFLNVLKTLNEEASSTLCHEMVLNMMSQCVIGKC